MIELYPSKLEGQPLERHKTDRVMTIESWLVAKVPSYQVRESPPISIEVNGLFIDPAHWAKVEFGPADTVRIYPEPKGTGLEIAAWAVVAAIVAVGAIMLTQKPLVTPSTANNAASGKGLGLAKTTANQVKLGDVIRECAGKNEIFPDYLTPTRRYFGTDPKVQWVEMLLCIGVGEFEIQPGQVRIGGTPIASLGSTASYAIYGPGESVAAEPARLWWHNSEEVGSTSTGSAGLTLTTTTNIDQQLNAATVQFSEYVVSVPVGAGWFPTGWDAGLIARIEVLYPYLFTAPADGSATVISGDYIPMLKPFVGMKIEVTGANAGDYVVASYDPYVPAVPAVTGSASMVTGSAAPTRYDFDVTPLTFTVSRGASTYSVTLSSATTNLAGLVTAVNAALVSTGLVASASGSLLRIAESASPYSGVAVNLGGSSSTVFGSSPVFVTGVKTVTAADAVPAKITLAYDGGAPAVGLQTGTLWSCIGYRDLRYRIASVSDDAVQDDESTADVDESHGPSAITVIRLTDTGAEDEDWLGYDDIETNTASITLDGSTTEGDWAGPFYACPEGETIRRFEVDFFFPQGLVRYTEKNGNIRSHWAKTEVQYRDASTAGAWTSVSYTFTAMSPDQQGYTRAIVAPTYIRPEVRIRRIGDESPENFKFNRVQWYGLRGRIDKAPTKYNDCTIMALYVRGGDKLSAQSQNQVSVIATRKLPILVDGSWSAPVATRDIVPWVNYVMKSAGGTDDDMDIDELARYGAIWNGRGDYFDYAVEDDSTVKECINDALLAGFAEFTLERGRVTPVRDEVRTQISHMYTPQNMTEQLKRSFTLPAPDDYDGVDIKYIDEKTRATEVVRCRLPGDLGLRVQTVTLKGVTNRDKAWRIGMRIRRAQVYRNKSYSWSTEFDALNSGYLSYDAVADDIPGYGQSSILLGITTGNGLVLLESSEPLTWKTGVSHVVGLRRPDGTVSGPWPATRLDDFRLTIASLDFEPDFSWDIDPPHLLFGESTRWCYPVLISSIDPGDHSADVEAVNYDPRVYADDDNFADN
ncbi:host specificity factor TipJ family phage tail protein [Pseudomonas sp. YuFO20]|uniref:host specificity factor TipJ family phage tail protein n=1 Tax=Pseudomonas sp. YuFO20 TaxID=3095362 RepID=UPI002B2475D5|nr:host specificity factor TipJ family phage tail protein [Pseudomonas sp. YuFO20]MEB2514782.1 host specificity factor TipJ family phage tail protein [Pseudomonas sp. YuFO20]